MYQGSKHNRSYDTTITCIDGRINVISKQHFQPHEINYDPPVRERSTKLKRKSTAESEQIENRSDAASLSRSWRYATSAI